MSFKYEVTCNKSKQYLNFSVRTSLVNILPIDLVYTIVYISHPMTFAYHLCTSSIKHKVLELCTSPHPLSLSKDLKTIESVLLIKPL